MFKHFYFLLVIASTTPLCFLFGKKPSEKIHSNHVLQKGVEFVLFTQPKTATHLLLPILTDLTGKEVYWAPEHVKNKKPLTESFHEASQNPEQIFFTVDSRPWSKKKMDSIWEINTQKGTFLHLHAPYSLGMEQFLIEKNCVNFFIKRDPRDQILSLLNHYKNINFSDKVVELIPSDDERLLYMIKKQSRIQTIHYMHWLDSPICCVLDFEKLMGNPKLQIHEDALDEMRKIAKALQLNLSDNYLEKVYKKNLNHGWSFFKGKTGTWKNYFKEIHKIAIKEEIGDLLILLGYEQDLDW